MTPYYQDDAVEIYLGDCRDVLPSLPPVDLVLTDPPYGIDGGQAHEPNGDGFSVDGRSDMKFYLGTHKPHWLGLLDIPLFVSHRTLRERVGPGHSPLKALSGWALDSGGFTEVTKYGGWRTSEGEYIAAVYRYRDLVGNLEWASPMDWMCEPEALKATGFSIEQHQRMTLNNYKNLIYRAPDLPWVPVLQGWNLMDYYCHAGMYKSEGIDLWEEPLVGLGSVCRRQGTIEVAKIIHGLGGLKLHGYGVKTLGLKEYSHLMVSTDSMAWSRDARYHPAIDGHTHQNCANCIEYALKWREKLLSDETLKRRAVA